VNQRALWVAMAAFVLVVWLLGAALTRFTLEEMAYLAPLAVIVVGVTVGLVVFWVKVVRDSLRDRRNLS
jgi:uncharacterized membrane protein